jgi:cell division protein FtsB
MMKERLVGLIQQLDPEIQELVAEVILLEREHLDMLKPRGVKEKIRDAIDKYARYGLGADGGAGEA